MHPEANWNTENMVWKSFKNNSEQKDNKAKALCHICIAEIFGKIYWKDTEDYTMKGYFYKISICKKCFEKESK